MSDIYIQDMEDIEIISLGSNCSIKYSINSHHNKTTVTYPFDWILTLDVKDIIDVIQSDQYDKFINFSEYKIIDIRITNSNIDEKYIFLLNLLNLIKCDDLKNIIINSKIPEENKITKIIKEIVFSTIREKNLDIDLYDIDDFVKILYSKLVCVLKHEDITLVHDHHINLSWHSVVDKYHRRFQRFLSLKSVDKKIFFIRYGSKLEDINILFNVIKNNYKNPYLLYLNHDVKKDNFQKINEKLYLYEGKLEFNQLPLHKNIIDRFISEVFIV